RDGRTVPLAIEPVGRKMGRLVALECQRIRGDLHPGGRQAGDGIRRRSDQAIRLVILTSDEHRQAQREQEPCSQNGQPPGEFVGERHTGSLLSRTGSLTARTWLTGGGAEQKQWAASVGPGGRLAGGPAGMALKAPKPRSSASPPFGGFALSSATA